MNSDGVTCRNKISTSPYERYPSKMNLLSCEPSKNSFISSSNITQVDLVFMKLAYLNCFIIPIIVSALLFLTFTLFFVYKHFLKKYKKYMYENETI